MKLNKWRKCNLRLKEILARGIFWKSKHRSVRFWLLKREVIRFQEEEIEGCSQEIFYPPSLAWLAWLDRSRTLTPTPSTGSTQCSSSMRSLPLSSPDHHPSSPWSFPSCSPPPTASFLRALASSLEDSLPSPQTLLRRTGITSIVSFHPLLCSF